MTATAPAHGHYLTDIFDGYVYDSEKHTVTKDGEIVYGQLFVGEKALISAVDEIETLRKAAQSIEASLRAAKIGEAHIEAAHRRHMVHEVSIEHGKYRIGVKGYTYPVAVGRAESAQMTRYDDDPFELEAPQFWAAVVHELHYARTAYASLMSTAIIADVRLGA